MVLHWVGVDRFKLHNHFRRRDEVKVFLSKEIKTMVLWRCGDDLVAIRIGYGLGVDDYSRLVVIHHIVAR